jgi:hypothetical protein
VARIYVKRTRPVGRPLRNDPLAIHLYVGATRRRLDLSANQACDRIIIRTTTESEGQWFDSVVTGPTLRRIYTRNRAAFDDALKRGAKVSPELLKSGSQRPKK